MNKDLQREATKLIGRRKIRRGKRKKKEKSAKWKREYAEALEIQRELKEAFNNKIL